MDNKIIPLLIIVTVYMSGVCPGTVSPKYLVVKVSESARFNCIPDAGATYIQWYLSISGGQTVVGVFEQPSLVIDDAQLSIAGLYQCVWTTPNGNRNQSSGLLVVLENDPVFSSNASHDGVVDEDVVTLTCSVSLRDYLIYSISILDTFGNSLNHSNGTLDTSYDTVNYISAEYSVHANSTIDETFKCIIEFFDAYVDSHDKGTLFYNRTLYTSLDVMYPVRNVHPNSTSVFVNGTIECQSDAFPPVFKYEWKYLGPTQHSTHQDLGNSTDIDIFNTTEGSLTLFTPGKFNFKCTAFNLVKNINYNSTWIGVIKVSDYYTEAIHEAAPGPIGPAGIAGIVGGCVSVILLLIIGISVVAIFVKRRQRPESKKSPPLVSSTYLTFDQTSTSQDQPASTSMDPSNQAYTPYTMLSPSTRQEPTPGSGDPSTYAQLEMSYMALDASSRDLSNTRQPDPSSTYMELNMPYMQLDASSPNLPRPNQPGPSSTYTELEMPYVPLDSSKRDQPNVYERVNQE